MSPLAKALSLAASPAGRKALRQAVKVARSDEGKKLISQARKVASSPEGRKLLTQAREAAKQAGVTARSHATRERIDAIRSVISKRTR